MEKFTDIIGQPELIEYFYKAISKDRIAGAYIIHGERYSGKEFIAKIFASALQCEKNSGLAERTSPEPCGECRSCKQAKNNNHPDIHWVAHEKPNSIGVDDIREQISDDVMIKPYGSRYKIYIITEGEKMTPQAQNALLKTLEEPPSYAVIIILATDLDLLLPTILSRSAVIRRKPVPDNLVNKYLMEELSVPDYQANICTAFARGNIGRAKILAHNEEFEKIKRDTIRLLKYIGNMDMPMIVDAVKSIHEYKVEISDCLDIFSVWYRDVLIFKATADVNRLVFKEEINVIEDVVTRCAYEGLENILSAIEKAKGRLRANVNFDLTMELLLVTIKDNLTGISNVMS